MTTAPNHDAGDELDEAADEAARAEGAEPGPTADDGQAAEQPPPPVPLSEREIEQRHRKLEAEAERHAKRVADIMGDDFALLVPSPLDFTPGYVLSPEIAPLPPQVVEATMALLGVTSPAHLLEADDAERCPKCDGWGVVLTGARNDANRTKPCRGCSGTGWKMRPHAVEQPPAGPQPPPAAQPTLAQPGGPVAADRWGRPYGHPHFNIDPVTIGV